MVACGGHGHHFDQTSGSNVSAQDLSKVKDMCDRVLDSMGDLPTSKHTMQEALSFLHGFFHGKLLPGEYGLEIRGIANATGR